jgi:hypothetical protein
MVYSATKLRQNLYNILDRILETGIPAEIERKGKRLRIVPENPVSKLDRLEPHDTINGDPDSILDLRWDTYWQREPEL